MAAAQSAGDGRARIVAGVRACAVPASLRAVIRRAGDWTAGQRVRALDGRRDTVAGAVERGVVGGLAAAAARRLNCAGQARRMALLPRRRPRVRLQGRGRDRGRLTPTRAPVEIRTRVQYEAEGASERAWARGASGLGRRTGHRRHAVRNGQAVVMWSAPPDQPHADCTPVFLSPLLTAPWWRPGLAWRMASVVRRAGGSRSSAQPADARKAVARGYSCAAGGAFQPSSVEAPPANQRVTRARIPAIGEQPRAIACAATLTPPSRHTI